MKHPLTRHSLPHVIFACLFLLYVFIGAVVFRDYGVPTDEYSQIELGRMNYERVVRGSRELDGSWDRYYGPAFETVLHVFSPLVSKLTGAGAIDSRHFLVFLYSAASVMVLYVLMWRLTGSAWYGVLAALFLVCSPRQFAQSFYNSKDMAFLATGVFLLLSLYYALDFSPKTRLIHTFLTGYAMAVRPQTAVFVIASIVAVFLMPKKTRMVKMRWSIWYLVLSAAWTYAFFPILWDGPFRHLVGFFGRSLDSEGAPTLYFGKFYTSPDVPWHRLPVWVAITSPVSVVVLALVGSIGTARKLLGKARSMSRSLVMGSAMMVIVWGTLVSAAALHARNYDGWRHIYYIYPSLIGLGIFAFRGWNQAVRHSARRVFSVCMMVFVVADLCGAVWFMARNHPNEYVYFNAFAGGYPRAKSQFDFDYWGISYRQITEYLLTLPVSGARVYVREPLPYVVNEMQPRLTAYGYHISDTAADADIIILLWHYDKSGPPLGFTKLYAVSVGGADLSAVYVTDAFRTRLERGSVHAVR